MTDASRRITAHRICMVFRGHAAVIFWLSTCAAFAAGLAGATWALAVVLGLDLAILLHVSARLTRR